MLSVLCGLFFFFGVISVIRGSGAYDHGTATGRGKLELDLTWNPFNLFDQGQSYVVFGYGLTDRLDLHGYYASPMEESDNYYFGLFHQFFEYRSVDLATAVGIRRYTRSDDWHVFFPQVLYSVRLGKGFSVGGSAVTLQRVRENPETLGTTFDVALFVPLTKFVPGGKWIEEVKLGVGAFRPVLWQPKRGNWYPAYSVDMKFDWRGKGKD